MTQVLCASYADYKYGRKTKDFDPAIEWKWVGVYRDESLRVYIVFLKVYKSFWKFALGSVYSEHSSIMFTSSWDLLLKHAQ